MKGGSYVGEGEKDEKSWNTNKKKWKNQDENEDERFWYPSNCHADITVASESNKKMSPFAHF